MQTLRAQPATIAATFPSAPGAVAVDVARLDGTLIRAAAPATVAGNVASVALTATETATLDTLTAAFTSATLGTLTATVEVVGAVLFTVAEARAYQPGGNAPPLASSGTYPDSAIEAMRESVTARFERVCKVSFIPRYRLRTITGEDWYTLTLPDQPLIAVRAVATRVPGSPTFVDFTSDQLAALDSDLATGVLSRGGYYGNTGLYTEARLPSLTVRVGYEYGYSQPPQPIKDAALHAAVYLLRRKDIGDRTTSISTEAGTFRLATAGYGQFQPFGLPEVDAVLADYREVSAGIA